MNTPTDAAIEAAATMLQQAQPLLEDARSLLGASELRIFSRPNPDGPSVVLRLTRGRLHHETMVQPVPELLCWALDHAQRKLDEAEASAAQQPNLPDITEDAP
jgi:hypothetical protein